MRQKPRLHQTRAAAHSLVFNSWQEVVVFLLSVLFFDFYKCKLALILAFIFWPACLEVGNAVMTWQDS